MRIGRVLDLQALVAGGGEVCIGAVGREAVGAALDDMGWYTGNSDWKTHPVAQKTPNAWGLYDMHGNVLEWCADRFGDYPSGAVTDPSGASWVGNFLYGGGRRVLRGGSWGSDARYCRSAYRSCTDPGSRYEGQGLRVVLAPVQ